MQLRRVEDHDGPCVQAHLPQGWVRLGDLDRLAQIAGDHGVSRALESEILGVLKLGPKGWSELEDELLELTPSQAISTPPMLPIAPQSFRDFMLYEKHVIDSSRGYARRFMPGAYQVATMIEALTGKTFPKFKPKPLWYRQPIYYFSNHLNFLTDGEAAYWPSHTRALDYELELGAILAQPLVNATPDEARAAIGGFVLLNDFSARDVQLDEMNSGFGPQRSKHFVSAMSAIVVTADEVLPSIDQLTGCVSINGKKIAQVSSVGGRYSLAEAIAFVSQNEPLHPGELFGSGTLPGGSGMENGHWLKPGDTLTLSIDHIGQLSNQIVSSEPGARRAR